ncbi:protein lethal(2)essential for life-like [Macrosteles quadrilineatus]|uniref:protein lethal(2)essential for life-like n=1 Tax=Macrosteles quadrilineatus TaxID=74068 RepID=UPI0023E1A154|nr:protein lethal(2)essential for life-like [Macrosteles quadrilineatus]
MSLVPLLFRDWWDEFDRERPSRLLDQHFGLGLRRDDLWNSFAPSSLRPAGGYFRPWRAPLARSNSGTSSLVAEADKVQVILDVQQFSPNEITVKTADNYVIVEGKHEEKQDEHGFISRHFVRRYLLPKDVEVNNITSSLSSDGVLTISAPKKMLQEGGERSVPIIQTGAPALKPAPNSAPHETNIKIEQQ